jgi:hypothetical protein
MVILNPRTGQLVTMGEQGVDREWRYAVREPAQPASARMRKRNARRTPHPVGGQLISGGAPDGMPSGSFDGGTSSGSKSGTPLGSGREVRSGRGGWLGDGSGNVGSGCCGDIGFAMTGSSDCVPLSKGRDGLCRQRQIGTKTSP